MALIKKPSALSNDLSFRKTTRWALIGVAAVLALMQMSSGMGVYQTVLLGGTGTSSSYDDPQNVELELVEGGAYQRRAGSQEEEEEEEEITLQEGQSLDEEESEEEEEERTVREELATEKEKEESTSEEDEQKEKEEEYQSTTTITTTSTTSSSTSLAPTDSTTIRKWGCARNETPFIFVHIGKAGGGGVRARIAASALHYNRTDWHRPAEDQDYYYPVYDDAGQLHKGKLVHSEAGNMLPHFPDREEDFIFQRTFRFEKSLPCHATTPIGHAVACHMEKNICHSHRDKQSDDNSDRCDLVYMGHNVIGGEMNFLPTPYLTKWWKNTTWAEQDDQPTSILSRLENRYTRSHRIYDPTKDRPAKRNCQNGALQKFSYNKMYEKCIYPETKVADLAARTAVQKNDNNWGPLYASLPVLRVTMLREPFSWLKSKFFWMENHMDVDGKGLVLAFKGQARMERMKRGWTDDKKKKYADSPVVQCDHVDHFVKGWGKQGALEYIFYLCGEHCMGQWQAIQETYGEDEKLLKEKHAEYLQVMEEQAAYNLRNSFAVVGLLEETQDFFDLISQRVFYMDTSLNPRVKGQSHSSGNGPEQRRCSERFKDEEFRKEILEKGPEIRIMMNLYHLGLEVNKFQKEELAQCSTA